MLSRTLTILRITGSGAAAAVVVVRSMPMFCKLRNLLLVSAVCQVQRTGTIPGPQDSFKLCKTASIYNYSAHGDRHNRKAGPGWISSLRMGAFYCNTVHNFSITSPERFFFGKSPNSFHIARFARRCSVLTVQ